ncbi:methyltransferase [Pycnococcus provasolii]
MASPTRKAPSPQRRLPSTLILLGVLLITILNIGSAALLVKLTRNNATTTLRETAAVRRRREQLRRPPRHAAARRFRKSGNQRETGNAIGVSGASVPDYSRRREQDGGLARTHANDNSHNSVPLNQRDATLSPDGGRLGRVWDASGSAAAAALSPVLCETEKRAISPGTEVRVATVSVPLPSSREGETKTFRIATYGKHDIVSGSILTNGNWEPQTADL